LSLILVIFAVQNLNILFQTTIKKSISINGVGLHTGESNEVKFNPAPANHGIKFQRIDLEGEPIIPADADLVTTVARGTTLEKGKAVVTTIEHCLAAICGLQIDNILIQVTGAEIPILDGSSKPFIDLLENAGIETLEVQREEFELRTNIHYIDPETGVEMLAMPSDRYKVTALIDYKSPTLGQQHASLDKISDFKEQFSQARTFCFLHELEMLMQANLIKGGDLDNAIVVVDKTINEEEIQKLAVLFNKPDIKVVKEGILNNVELRYPNEPARHKLLDIVGDLALIGMPIKAHIIATKPGHKSNVEFAKKLKAHIKAVKNKVEVPVYDPNKKPVYNIQDIEKMLPHRYPFLLVDKIIDLNEKYVVGVKNVTFNEPFFQGHFPSNPVMPGVLQIEAMAQTGGILALNSVDNASDYDTYFMKIDKVKFRQKVIPGDTLIFKLELSSPIRRGIIEMRGTAFVGDNVVAEAELVAIINKRTTEK
jgi:UDP-3-O-[3-hydroxymyristoyl] N-acetylglucosamine deacetylase/3-hydroxyacyl-[acyl-carrier-protein] dehydratase